MNAVDEEFRKNVGEDGWRVLHVHKELADPAHPYSYFNTGNLESMKRISQDTLQAWYRTHYVAPAMRLVLYSRMTPEWYHEHVPRLFGPLAAGPHPIATAAGTPSARARARARRGCLRLLKLRVGEQRGAMARTPDVPAARAALDVVAPAHIFPASLAAHWVHVVPIKDLREMTVAWELDAALCQQPSRTASLVSYGAGPRAWVGVPARRPVAGRWGPHAIPRTPCLGAASQSLATRARAAYTRTCTAWA